MDIPQTSVGPVMLAGVCGFLVKLNEEIPLVPHALVAETVTTHKLRLLVVMATLIEGLPCPEVIVIHELPVAIVQV